ncbi:MAG: hypothetical protein AB1521_11785 [Bacteroidota bacterium]
MKSMLKDFPTENELKKLIMHTSEIVWKKEITEKNIEKWLANFQGEVFSIEEERIIALWLLSNFVYYNEDEVRHLCILLFKEYIHNILSSYNDKVDIPQKIKNIVEKTRFLSLGRPSESSGYILYYFRQVNDLNMKNFFVPQDPSYTNIDHIVFVDDVTLSQGLDGQAFNVLKNFNSNNKKKLMLTMIATREAIDSLKRINVEVISAITLDDRNKCFSPNSFIFVTFPQHVENCRLFANYYGQKAKSTIPLGYNDGQFAFGFFYNTPDNTLPIFWGEENNWFPIVKRYDKNYLRKDLVYGQKFV